MNPYEKLESRAFWAPAVGQRNMFDIADLWRPKFPIKYRDRVVTFGSCFAQYFGQALKERGFDWRSTEMPPEGLPEADAKKFNYNIFSARTGNIYTASLLLQWTRWALGKRGVPEVFWEKDGRIYDPFRPNIEPNGFASVDEMLTSRLVCVSAFKQAIKKSSLFVFTLGLTESWWYREPGTEAFEFEYPMCPGTVAGEFDPERHHFVNQRFSFIEKNLTLAIREMQSIRPGLKFLLTVSPVPLTATNSGNHVLVASMQSKSILRTVASAVAEKHDSVDYFPSYEIINAAPYRGVFFEPNMRSVNRHGVDHVMRMFFNALRERGGGEVSVADKIAVSKKVSKGDRAMDVVCEEQLLAAFGAG